MVQALAPLADPMAPYCLAALGPTLMFLAWLVVVITFAVTHSNK